LETAKQLVDVASEAGAAGTKQTDIHPVGFYCGRRGIGDEWIDWSWSSRMIFNFIRSNTSPSQIARTNLGNVIVSIEKVSEIPNVPVYQCTPG
jgi:methionyl-tRNA formyltransferase